METRLEDWWSGMRAENKFLKNERSKRSWMQEPAISEIIERIRR